VVWRGSSGIREVRSGRVPLLVRLFVDSLRPVVVGVSAVGCSGSSSGVGRFQFSLSWGTGSVSTTEIMSRSAPNVSFGFFVSRAGNRISSETLGISEWIIASVVNETASHCGGSAALSRDSCRPRTSLRAASSSWCLPVDGVSSAMASMIRLVSLFAALIALGVGGHDVLVLISRGGETVVLLVGDRVGDGSTAGGLGGFGARVALGEGVFFLAFLEASGAGLEKRFAASLLTSSFARLTCMGEGRGSFLLTLNKWHFSSRHTR
jgi:hypothetical protein